MKYCTNCGSQISETPNFCPSCGNKIIYSESTHTPEPAIFDSLDTNVSDVIKTESKQEKQPNDKSVELKPNINNSNNKTIIIVGFTALIIVLVFIVILFSQGSKSAETQPSDSSASLNGVIENNTSSLQIPDAQDSSIDPNNTQSYETTDAVTERNILLRNNWTSYISASRSTFNYSEMGGISDLSIILTNNTEYIVDNVTVKVTIKTVNNYVYKTEYLYFENIKPNSRVEQFVMPTERGRYVEYEIINVYSDRLNFKWDEGDNTGNGSLEDPWKYNN
jgi:DNA-directed RNA polymerase subunit RPC12/RpoP